MVKDILGNDDEETFIVNPPADDDSVRRAWTCEQHTDLVKLIATNTAAYEAIARQIMPMMTESGKQRTELHQAVLSLTRALAKSNVEIAKLSTWLKLQGALLVMLFLAIIGMFGKIILDNGG